MKSKKGSAYERKFCKQLSEWWSFGKWDDVFWRTSQSGGRATTRMKKGLRTADSYGDVAAIREEGKPLTKSTFIELKRGYTNKKGKRGLRNISITDLLDTPDRFKTKPVILEWWLEACRKRKESGRKRSFVIYRRDRKTACIVMSRKFFSWLEDESRNGKMMCPPYYNFAWVTVKGVDLMVIPVETFFSWCKPQSLGGRRIVKRRRKIKRRK